MEILVAKFWFQILIVKIFILLIVADSLLQAECTKYGIVCGA